MVKKLVLYGCLCTLICLSFSFNSDTLQNIIAKLNNFTTASPQEKIHVHTDKPYYLVGEDIWLKAYIVNASNNQPSEISKIVYLELINQNNQLTKTVTLPTDSGVAFGHLHLPDSLLSGNYRLRAYTNYMRNFDEAFFFEKFVSINTLADDKKIENKSVGSKIDVQFFPEGGNLVYGLRCRVGLKVINDTGLGINVKGYITDEQGAKITDLNTEHAGMGSFAIKPEKGKKYKAVITNPNTSENIQFNLPRIEESGYNLSVNSNGANISLKLAVTPDKLKQQEINIIGQSNGIIFYSSTTTINSLLTSTAIAKDKFPTGIVQFTVFEKKEPVAERIIFVNHKDQIEINIEKRKTSKPDQNIFDISVTDANKNPLDGNFSVSVVDADKVQFNEDDETTILSNLLLTSDIKGFVEQPNYYFNNINPDKEKHLDNLLLTQGWRRFIWKDVINEQQKSLVFAPEKSLSFTGNVVNLNNKPEPNAKVTLFSATNGFDFILDTIADVTGKFVFDRLDIPDTVQLFVQAKTNNNLKTVKVVMDDSSSILPRSFIGKPFTLDAFLSNAKEQNLNSAGFNGDGIKLKQVTIAQKKQLKPIVNVANSKNRNGSADYVLAKDKIEYQTGSIFDIFNAGVPGLMMYNGYIVKSMMNTVSMAPNFKGKRQPVLVLLDGSETEQVELTRMPASTVEGIEVLVSNYNTAVYENGYWGVVIITTKSGAINHKTDVRFKSYNIVTVNSKGFGANKEFYVPKTIPSNSSTKTKTDFSTTLYWNPSFKSDTNGKGVITVQSTAQKKYKFIIEGFDENGNIGRKIYHYQASNLKEFNR